MNAWLQQIGGLTAEKSKPLHAGARKAQEMGLHNQQCVLDAIVGGCKNISEVKERTGLTRETTSRHFDALKNLGKIKKVGYALWVANA